MKRRVPVLVQTSALLLALTSGVTSAYTVQKGDTLYSLARREGVTVEALVQLNRLADTTLSVGQELVLPSEQKAQQIAGVKVLAPVMLKEGDIFTLRLTGERSAEARVRFLSEVNEDVRSPAEDLAPFGAAGEYVVLGRVVLGQRRPLTYEVRLGDERITGSVPVSSRGLKVQNLNLAPEIAARRQDPKRVEEEALVEKAYARRTPQAWSRPFLGVPGVRVVTSQFGQPRRYTKDEELKYHYGTDYAAPTGSPVQALNDGTVVVAGMYPARGGLVAIDHGAGVVSMYFHQSKLQVKVGDQVTRGQIIGQVGSTGISNGPHLHLEVRVRGEAVNPAALFNRMLP
ncbi:peptidoglycan DD-metalloendopeptidase family protein [Deinococcus peraridilitoris]|uniref:Metalloendopeptidase-like membrane protein n=1 Tax=Deinococcus peraridilitoris (strain DSM 19664 / LMG 22246 / CIP 109416 / KR-200) TaxID=937777 RepID=K9ZZ11_DEIPD|nr:M23 family metallopeptidase [Deinococcus peraridilitoris]AFZ65995.1 metalloendopeptidase-like membrane protein [Deinococcus peraridilitoris DSM 19664]